MKKQLMLLAIILQFGVMGWAVTPQYSTAGFYELPSSGRTVYNMNLAWRFHKGDMAQAFQEDFNDSSWQVVSLPNGIELLPEEASGSINYQGIVWYRKHFTVDAEFAGKKVFLHFEGIMGKSKVWINGQLVNEHFGGFLPVIADVTPYLRIGRENIIAVCADNSNDDTYAPGKPQRSLDFTYFGGIYRDCWLITHADVYITDPNFEQEKAGGGLFVSYPSVNEQRAIIALQLHLRNEKSFPVRGNVVFELEDLHGNKVTECKKTYRIAGRSAEYARTRMEVKNPSLWLPESPALYWLKISVKDEKGNVVDGYKQRIGIRSIELKGKDGLWLNGKPYDKLIGGNRHQDFAIIGNALPNSLHWRDAFKLRNAGMKVIRSAHYPQDPAFLDACDELGLFIIDATPGWQFYNHENALFAERVYDNIRNMVRRDRNRPSLLFYEPVLNETLYPAEFALQAKTCVDEEMNYQQAYSATDLSQNGVKKAQHGIDYYPVIYTHPGGRHKSDSTKVYFTREFGDNVDDWSANNSTSRVCRAWGEVPMLVQAEHYAFPSYPATCIESFYEVDRAYLGGTLWHSFDHQRGCNSITFYGGIMDAFRQPKTSYYMFMSQRSPLANEASLIKTGPMVYVANEMTPFSPKDVAVFSNCEEVRLTVFEGGKQYVWKRSDSFMKMPSPIITFRDVFDFMATKTLSRAGRQKEVYLLAEGLIGGKVVATHKRIPARKSIKIRVRLDNDGMPLVADGSDIVTVIAEVIDKDGTVKRLNNNIIHFSVEGEGVLLSDVSLGTNPIRANWGSAPILLRSTTTPGKIKIKASISGEGVNAIEAGELEVQTVAPTMKYVYDSQELVSATADAVSTVSDKGKEYVEVEMLKKQIRTLQKVISENELRQMEKQQEIFGE